MATESEVLNEQLTRVRTIIADIETRGYSELQIDGKRFTTLDLSVLYSREQYLIGRLEAETDTDTEGFGRTTYVQWDNR